MDSYQSVWEFERIGISAPDIDKLLNHDYKFPLVKIDNLEKVLAELAS